MLKRFLDRPFTEDETLLLTGSMHTLTEESSLCEQNAAQAERDADKLMAAVYMSDHKRDTFELTVTRLLKNYAVVTMDNSVEGVLPYRNMKGDYSPDSERTVLISSRTGKAVYLGDKLTLRPCYTEAAQGYIEFEMA